MSNTKAISVQYFALFREQRGCSAESVQTNASTLAELYAELQRAYRFTLPLDRVQVAVDNEFSKWDEPLKSNSTVVFIPPVAGG